MDCIEPFNEGEIGTDTTFRVQQKLFTDEYVDSEFREFTIENFSEMVGYIVQENLNIRIHRDITGEMWFGVGKINL